MARPLRIEYSGALYHLTSRGDNRKFIFKDDNDRMFFLNTLKNVNKRYNWLCHAYCLMNNHYHLVIETSDGNLSKGMRQLNGIYTQYFNKKHKRVGHLFQGRYKALLIQKESHLLEVCRYVVLNPVRAKSVKSPAEWKWSSYNATSGLESPDLSLTTGWILEQFGAKKKQGEVKYRKFVKEGIGGEKIWKDVKCQILLGKDDFVAKFKNHLKGNDNLEEIPKSQRYMGRPLLGDIFKKEVDKNINKRNRLIFDSVEKHGYSQKEIADYLNMHYSTISRVMKDINMSKYKT